MTPNLESAMTRVHELVDEYRAQCLWYTRLDYYPETVQDALRALDAIARHGDVAAFKKTASVRKWLLQHSNNPSVG